MSDAELREYLLHWCMDYCNNAFVNGVPSGVELFLDQAIGFIKIQLGKTSESLGDYSVSVDTTKFPRSMLDLLSPYKKLGVIL